MPALLDAVGGPAAEGAPGLLVERPGRGWPAGARLPADGGRGGGCRAHRSVQAEREAAVLCPVARLFAAARITADAELEPR